MMLVERLGKILRCDLSAVAKQLPEFLLGHGS
jgi:hypothetical protein